MPITRRKAAARVALAGLIVLVFLAGRRFLLVGSLALKILDHTEALDAWKGPVLHRTVEHAGIPIDIYGADGSPLLIIHGVNTTGKNSLDLMRISEALAQVGYQVFVPDLIAMKRLHLVPDEVVRIKSVFQFIGKDAGIACFSYGCGPALIAAADVDIRAHVRFAIAFGGYFDVRETLEFVITGPETPTAYLKWYYLEANADVALEESDRSRLKRIAELSRWKHPIGADIVDGLTPEGKALLRIFHASTREEFRTLLQAGGEPVNRRLDLLSPSGFVKHLQAPVVVIHGINDPVVPARQSIELAEAARANGLDSSLTLLRMYGHVNPVLPKVGVGSIFDFYLLEMFRLLRVLNRIVSLK